MIEPLIHYWPKPVIALAGFSGSGKTTLAKQIVAYLNDSQQRIGVIKHSHHQVELDQPGKDSFELKQAGAEQLILSMPEQTIMFTQQHDHDNLDAQLKLLNWDELDMVIVEGYRHAQVAKLEIHRPSYERPLLCRDDPCVFAVACDEPLMDCPVPQWPLNDPQQIATHLLKICKAV